ncbi:MAG: GAF domain-containing SpoIIE family protein phosphatase [Solirubrobacteraceae bacterium]
MRDRDMRGSGESAAATGYSATALLVEAGAVLATSLDPRTTMAQVAQLTVPQLADLCTIDLLARDGTITEAAVAASERQTALELEALRARSPVDPRSEHPVARVIRSGEPELIAWIDESMLRSYTQDDEHARFMLEHAYRSAAVAPLLARGRTLGALATLRLGDGKPYTAEDLALIGELARRAALAIDNAQIFTDLQRIEQRLEAVLVNLAEAVTLVDEAGRVVFANDAAAELAGASGPAALIARDGGMTDWLLLRDEQGAELTGDPLPSGAVLSASTRDGLAGAAQRRAATERLLVRATVRASGQERWLHLRSCPLADPETGWLRWSLNVYEDVTEVKGAQIAQAQIAHTLQQALLPSSVPTVRGFEIAARYAPAGELNEVGGDFYEVIEQGRERSLLVIGDVCGKGSRAASVTALARHTLRAGALVGAEPLSMLQLLHEALRRQPAGADLCTVCIVSIVRERDHALLSVALAGHPQPLLANARGVTRLGEPGTLLGVIDPISVLERTATLQHGETLLLYTDGVAEAGRARGALSEQGLIDLCADCGALSLPELLDRIEGAALERGSGMRRDDIALLGVRLADG